VFFDGTGNSLGIDGDAKSNVAKLYKHYLKGEIEENFIVGKHYEVGIGTYMTQKEYDTYIIQRKIDKGYGGGGAKRIYRAIDAVCAFLKDKESGDNPSQYKSRTIDVFGFSRGAAEARDFVNTFYFELVKIPDKQYQDVRFNFIGIFDTVGSFGIAGNNIDRKPASKDYANEVSEADGFSEHTGSKLIRKKRVFPTQAAADEFAQKKQQAGWQILYNSNATVIYALTEKELYTSYNFNLQQGVNASAKHIVHFVAHDEKRYNFPLTNIAGSGGVECVMIGVHSDVGGGYKKSMTQELSFSLKYTDVQARAKAKAQGWKEGEVSYFYGTPTSIKMTKQKIVSNELSVVYWHLMHLLAKRYDLHLKEPSEAINPELVPYFEYAKANIVQAHTYASTPHGQLIKEKYIHYSSVDIADIDTFCDGDTKVGDLWSEDSPDLIGGNDMRYIDTQTGKRVDAREHPSFPKNRLLVKREIFNNNPTRAVKPTK
jgi:uncharacterized protein (DUF2235 family)